MGLMLLMNSLPFSHTFSSADVKLQEQCLKLVRENCGQQVEPEVLALDSVEVFDLFYQGHILGLLPKIGIPSEYFYSSFLKLRPRDLKELAVIFGYCSAKGIPLIENVCKKATAFPKAPQQNTRFDLRRLFDELHEPAPALSTAWFAYQMGWLKRAYPQEFYSVLLGSIETSERMREMVVTEMEARGLPWLNSPTDRPTNSRHRKRYAISSLTH